MYIYNFKHHKMNKENTLVSLQQLKIISRKQTIKLIKKITLLHIFSCINGWVSAWFIDILLAGSSIKIFSRRSFSWQTFRYWSSGKRWEPTNSAWRSRLGLIFVNTTTFSYKKTIKTIMISIGKWTKLKVLIIKSFVRDINYM